MPSSSGIFAGGNQRSHCAASPADQLSRSAGSTGRCSGLSRRTFSRSHVIEPRPLDPLRDHRRRHLRMLREQRSDARLERRERRRLRWPLILRRPIRRQCSIDRRPTDTQLPRDLPLRNSIRDEPPNQCPVFHRDHPPNRSGWPRFRPSLWPRFQPSPTLESNLPRQHRGKRRGCRPGDLRFARRDQDPRADHKPVEQRHAPSVAGILAARSRRFAWHPPRSDMTRSTAGGLVPR